MIRWALRRAIETFDRNYDAGYARDMIDASPPSPPSDTCMRVVVGGTRVMFDHGRAPAAVALRTA